jgi:predicted small metal-binding protein
MAHHTKGYKELGCRDFRQNCGFTVRAKSEDEILDRCREHACKAHGKCATIRLKSGRRSDRASGKFCDMILHSTALPRLIPIGRATKSVGHFCQSM